MTIAVILFLFPVHSDDSIPPHHYSLWDYEVPWENPAIAIALGLLAGLIVWVLAGRRKSK